MHSIKNHKPKRNSGFIQGYFPINECKKYFGQGPIIFRSSWERKFCLYCERTPEIIMWSSESISIKYFNPLDEKYHTYYPDYLVKLRDGTTFLVEVKPKAQLIKPTEPKRLTPKSIKSYKWAYNTWMTNMVKKEAADSFAKARGWKYMIVTEDFFKNKE
jgi:hypothetical protein